MVLWRTICASGLTSARPSIATPTTWSTARGSHPPRHRIPATSSSTKTAARAISVTVTKTRSRVSPNASTYRSIRRSADATTPRVPTHSAPSASRDSSRSVRGLAGCASGGDRDDDEREGGDHDQLGEPLPRVLGVGEALRSPARGGGRRAARRPGPSRTAGPSRRARAPGAATRRASRPPAVRAGRRTSWAVRARGARGPPRRRRRARRRRPDPAAGPPPRAASGPAKTRSALANRNPNTSSRPTVIPTLRSATSSCPRREPASVSRPFATHGSARTVPAAQVSGASTAAGADRADVTATTPVQAATSAQSATTQPASRRATTAKRVIDSAAVTRSFTSRRRISAGAAAAQTSSPISAAPRPGACPTSSTPPSTPDHAAQDERAGGDRSPPLRPERGQHPREPSGLARDGHAAARHPGGWRAGESRGSRGRRCSGVAHGRHARTGCPRTSETCARVPCTLCAAVPGSLHN